MRNRSAWCLLFLFAIATVSHASEYCALRVKVLRQSGVPNQTSVALKTSSGQLLQTVRTGADGIADFCDLGFGLFDVVIGPDVCGQVVVRFLQFNWWPHTEEVKAIYENCHANVPHGGCDVILRVRSADGKPLADVSFSGQGLPPGSKSDSYGRLLGFLPWGRRIAGSLTKSGYRTEALSVACEASGDHQFERQITMIAAQ
jgi:hypothetical protein